MKRISVFFATLFFFLPSSPAQAAQSTCGKFCAARMSHLAKGCVTTFRFRKNQCRKWSLTRKKLCTQQKGQARKQFCRNVYGKRVYRCFLGMKKRRGFCVGTFKRCNKLYNTRCQERCRRNKNAQACYRLCKKVTAKLCIRAFQKCVKDTKERKKRCISYAKSRRQSCMSTVTMGIRACKAQVAKASRVCLGNATARYYACRKYSQGLYKACLSRCKRY